MSWQHRIVFLFCLTVGASSVALPAASQEPSTEQGRGLHQHSRNAIQTGDDLMDSIYSDCLRKDSVSCVKYKLFSFVDKVLGSKDSFTLTEGVTVVKTPGAAPAGDGAPRALGDEEGAKDFESMVFNRVERFLKTHTLKVDLNGNEVLNAVTSAGRALGDVADSLGLTEEEEQSGARDMSEERGKKKKAKILLPLLLLLKLKAAALIPLILGAIALIAGKALIIGKIALVISAIIALQKLLSQQNQQQKTVTYEIVSHPHHTSSSHHDSFSSGGDVSYGSSGSGGHGGWGRSSDGQQLAYRAYAPATQQ